MPNSLSGLVIRQPHIDFILDGRKTWEMRSLICRRRGQIALIQSGSMTVVGVADVVDCIGPLTDEQRLASEGKHCVAPEVWVNQSFVKYRYAWVLTNARRLTQPVPYNHPIGAVTWVTLDDSVTREVATLLQNHDNCK